MMMFTKSRDSGKCKLLKEEMSRAEKDLDSSSTGHTLEKMGALSHFKGFEGHLRRAAYLTHARSVTCGRADNFMHPVSH